MFDMFVIPNKTFKKRIPKIKEMMVKLDDATGGALCSEGGCEILHNEMNYFQWKARSIYIECQN